MNRRALLFGVCLSALGTSTCGGTLQRASPSTPNIVVRQAETKSVTPSLVVQGFTEGVIEFSPDGDMTESGVSG